MDEKLKMEIEKMEREMNEIIEKNRRIMER